MIVFIVFLIILLVMIIVYNFKMYNNKWKYSEKLCGEKTLPIIGNAHQFGSTPADYLKHMLVLCEKYNYRPFRAWFGSTLYVFISDPEDIKLILSSNKLVVKGEGYEFFQSWIGNGLITSTGDKWFKHRRIITPTFHFKILNDFQEAIDNGGNRLCDKFKELSYTNNFNDIQSLVNLSTLDIICETAMGVKLNMLDDPESKIIKAFHDVSFCLYRRIFSPWKRNDFLYRFSSDYKMNVNAVKILKELNETVIRKRRQFLIDNNVDKFIKNELDDNDITDDNNDIIDDNNDIYAKRKIKIAFLDTLLLHKNDDDGKELTDTEISDEVSTFIFAGHDTTAATISFAIYHISIYPEEQQKLYDEQKSIFISNNRTADCSITSNDISKMKYLDLFLKESQRMISSVPFIARLIDEKLDLNGNILPVNSTASLFLFGMGHNPNVFSNPSVFNPKRFELSEREHKNPYEYVPFSAGPRNCVGQRFAILELKIILSKLIRNFEFSSDIANFKPILATNATTCSNNGIYVKIKLR